MTRAEFGKLGSRLLILVFLLAGISFLESDRSSAAAVPEDCYASCQRISRFCNDHPDGLYENLDGINECSSFVSTQFCYTWDCPHPFISKFTYSPCLYNPSLPQCECNQVPAFCGSPASLETCPNIVDNCRQRCEANTPPGYHCCEWQVDNSCMQASCKYTYCQN
jgi:hypothetical protein